MIFRHTHQEVSDYYERIGLNQSSLKVIITDGMQAFLDKQETLLKQEDDDVPEAEKKCLIIGSAVDTYITMGQPIFETKYHVSKLVKKPGPKSMVVLKMAFERARDKEIPNTMIDLTYYKQEIYDAMNLSEFYMNQAKPRVEDDNRIQRLIKDNGAEYWNDLLEAKDKQILSDNEINTTMSIIASLETHAHTRDVFKDSSETDIVYQLPLYFDYEGVDCKALLDMVIVNHRFKRIKPVDLKTMWDEYTINFNRNAKKRRYDLQGSFYTNAMHLCKAELGRKLGRDLSDYTVSNLAFIAESALRPGCPVIVPMTDRMVMQGAHGNDQYKGWIQGLRTFKAWQAVDFNATAVLSAVGGILFLDENFKYVNTETRVII